MLSPKRSFLQILAFLLLPLRLTFGNTNRPNNVQICLNALGKDGDYYIWFFGDFVCDDVLNIEECDYDGGDCCRDIETITEACTICKCHFEESEIIETSKIISFFKWIL